MWNLSNGLVATLIAGVSLLLSVAATLHIVLNKRDVRAAMT